MPTPLLQEDHFSDKLDLRLWRGVLKFALRHPRELTLWFVCAVGLALLDASYGLITKWTIDDVTGNGAARLGEFAAMYAGVSLLLAALVWVFIHSAGRLANHMSHDIRDACFRRLQELEFAFFDARPTGWLVSRLTSDCDRLARLLAWGVVDCIWGPILVTAIAIVLLVLDARLALLVLSVVPPLVVLSRFFQKRILLSAREVRRFNSQITASFSEGIQGVKTTKTLVREEANLGEFRGLAGKMFSAAFLNARQSAMYYPLVLALGSAAGALALWHGGHEVAGGAMTYGTLVAFMTYAGQFFLPINQVARVLTELQGAQAAGERVLGLLATEPAIRDSAEVKKAIADHARGPARAGVAEDGQPDSISTVEFKNVTFGYGDGPPVLKEFSLRVKAGDTIALVGPSGGGKSTIVSLLCRFYEPRSGEIEVDGTDYRSRSLAWYQRQLGIVLQQPHLFAGSIRENIRYGRLDATDAEVEEAARLVNADGFIRELPEGYSTDVGEGGNRLSTGQKQLLSFARALLAQPRIFVMDEATSSIDTETERLIQQGLQRVFAGRISFVIAHRLSTIRNATRILVITGGRIEESGTHEELIARRGHYHDLYTSQYHREREEQVLAAGAEGAS